MVGIPSSAPQKDTDTLANGIIFNEITLRVIKMWIDTPMRGDEVAKEAETRTGEA